MSEQRFLDIIGAANLVPGPSSTQTVMHSGYARAGWPGLFIGGTLFILPAAFLVLVFAWLYVRYGTTTGGTWLLYGIKPVIIAVVVQALWGLGRTAVKSVFLGAVCVAVVALYLLGVNVILLLFGAVLLVMLVENGRRLARQRSTAAAFTPAVGIKAVVLLAAAGVGVTYTPLRMFLTFLKIGAVLYGSGYVLLAFLQGNFVDHLGWLTQKQLLDAVAVGQFTPGPVFTTATFVGYIVGGFKGALVATLGIFIPAYTYVALTVPILPHLRKSPWTAAGLDGVNAAAVGLMIGVALQLGRAAIIDWFTALLAIVATLLLIRFKINSAWIVLGGGIAGILFKALT